MRSRKRSTVRKEGESKKEIHKLSIRFNRNAIIIAKRDNRTECQSTDMVAMSKRRRILCVLMSVFSCSWI